MRSAADLRAALRARLPIAEYALLFEVSNMTGFGRNRSADAIAMSLWPSRGLEVFGFEIKVSRGDWLRELKDPAKAEPIAQYCDRWIVLAPTGIVKSEEVPAGWGLWQLDDGDKLSAAITPPKLTPVALDRTFIAALLRRASEADDSLVQAAVHRLRETDEKELEKRITREVDYRTRQHKRLADDVAAFEQASGVKIDHWNGRNVGQAVRLVLAQQESNLFANARALRGRLDELLALDAETP